MARIIGLDKHLRRLARMGGPGMRDGIYRELLKGGALIQREVVTSIHAHRSAGRSYRRGNVVHVASAPGQPPNSDTGQYAGSIHTQGLPAEMQVTVGTPQQRGKALEFGSRKMRARPHFRPAVRKLRKGILASVAAFIRGTIKD